MRCPHCTELRPCIGMVGFEAALTGSCMCNPQPLTETTVSSCGCVYLFTMPCDRNMYWLCGSYPSGYMVCGKGLDYNRSGAELYLLWCTSNSLL